MDVSVASAPLGFARWTGTSAPGRVLIFRVALCRPLHPGATRSSPPETVQGEASGAAFPVPPAAPPFPSPGARHACPPRHLRSLVFA